MNGKLGVGWILLLGSAMACGQARELNAKKCASNEPEPSLQGCTALIESGREAPTNLAADYARRGASYSKLGQYGKAIADFSASLQRDAKNAHTLDLRGRAYQHTQQYDLALADLNAAVQLEPGSARALQ